MTISKKNPDDHFRIHVVDDIDFLTNSSDGTYDVNIIHVISSDDYKTLESLEFAKRTTQVV